MVSGLVTSPCDQLRIFSGEATLILMESKSATAFPRSNGLERYKVSSCGIHDCRFRLPLQWPVVGDQCPVILPTLSRGSGAGSSIFNQNFLRWWLAGSTDH